MHQTFFSDCATGEDQLHPPGARREVPRVRIRDVLHRQVPQGVHARVPPRREGPRPHLPAGEVDGGDVVRPRLEVHPRHEVRERRGPHRRAAVLVRVLPPGDAAQLPREALLRRLLLGGGERADPGRGRDRGEQGREQTELRLFQHSHRLRNAFPSRLVSVHLPHSTVSVPSRFYHRRTHASPDTGTSDCDHQPALRQQRLDPAVTLRTSLVDSPTAERPRGD